MNMIQWKDRNDKITSQWTNKNMTHELAGNRGHMTGKTWLDHMREAGNQITWKLRTWKQATWTKT